MASYEGKRAGYTVVLGLEFEVTGVRGADMYVISDPNQRVMIYEVAQRESSRNE